MRIHSFAMPVAALVLLTTSVWQSTNAGATEPRNAIAHPNLPYTLAFYKRHGPTYRVAGALHFAHSKLHDVLLLTPFSRHRREDQIIYQQSLSFLNNPPRIEPSQELYAPYTARAAWRLFRVIDWAHALHEMTYDIMADQGIPWNAKAKALNGAYRRYLSANPDIVLSPAPLDLSMRRAAIMMQPYFSLTRNYYPKANNYFYAAHWWHPATYEAMMVGGNDKEQEQALAKVDAIFRDQVIVEPPYRMLLSRELMPRYSRLSPETANIFDTLHMLHGITYDIFAYDEWTLEQKRAELYRVIDAMSYQPGDEILARKFGTPRPNINPLRYDDWQKGFDGAMTQMMMEMLSEMMPAMMNHGGVDHQLHCELTRQLHFKLKPAHQTGELPGSFFDAMLSLMPAMKTRHQAPTSGEINRRMAEMMQKNWLERATKMADIESYPMDFEPSIETISLH